MFDQEEINKSLSKHEYEYLKFLGKGGFSNVFLCYSKKYKQEFAIKRIIKFKFSEYEYNNLISLNHSNIIRLYDVFEDDSSQYLVMDYCSQGTLKEKGALSYDKFVYYAKQILEAVAYCHSLSIAHRDIKPDNIFISQYDHVKLADFGIAKHFDSQSKSSEKCGTFKYFPPEMFQYQDVNPFKADIWSLGITFFYMATGYFPFQGSSRDKIERKIQHGEIDFTKFHLDPRIQYLIKKMTAKSYQNRPSAEQLLELPMFKKNANALNEKINAISNYRFKSSFNISKSLELELKGNSSSGNETPNKNQFFDIHSYKELNHFKNLRRLNSYFPPKKTF